MVSKIFKKLSALVFVLALLLVASPVFGAATCYVEVDTSGPFRTFVFDWTAHTDGAVASGTCDETITSKLKAVSGMIMGVKFEPSAGNAPTAAYDVVINTPGGADILFGVGANLTNDDSVSTQWQSPLTGGNGNIMLYQENLDLVVTNAGSGNQGKIFLFLY